MECAPWDDLYFDVNLSLFHCRMQQIIDFSLFWKSSESTEASAQLLVSNFKRSGPERFRSDQRGCALYACQQPRQPIISDNLKLD
jgi:hypothetical protein